YPTIWTTFQKGVGYRSFTRRVRGRQAVEGLIFENNAHFSVFITPI
ncbi:hypothetical protein MNBD_CHLOROFLEXI01-3664, partial [hydrothermal vent metagenome]